MNFLGKLERSFLKKRSNESRQSRHGVRIWKQMKTVILMALWCWMVFHIPLKQSTYCFNSLFGRLFTIIVDISDSLGLSLNGVHGHLFWNRYPSFKGSYVGWEHSAETVQSWDHIKQSCSFRYISQEYACLGVEVSRAIGSDGDQSTFEGTSFQLLYTIQNFKYNW